MRLISSRDTFVFLSQAAPKPWVDRMLRWMIYNHEVAAYPDEVTVRPYSTAFTFTVRLHKQGVDFSGPSMDAAIRKEFAKELADKLVGKNFDERVYDETQTWSVASEMQPIDAGFIAFASDIDWQIGTIKADWIPSSKNRDDFIFPNDEYFVSNFEDPDYNFEFTGIKFEHEKIEMLLPNHELQPSTDHGFVRADNPRAIGRPLKWNWEGSMAYIISLAQHPDGLPTENGAQAKIENMIADWFIRETGNSPSTSQIRTRAQTIIASLKMAEK